MYEYRMALLTWSCHRLLVVLKAEIETCMRLLGAQTIAELGPQFVR